MPEREKINDGHLNDFKEFVDFSAKREASITSIVGQEVNEVIGRQLVNSERSRFKQELVRAAKNQKAKK